MRAVSGVSHGRPAARIAAEVASDGISVWPGFLPEAHAIGLARHCAQQFATDGFRRAGVGRGARRMVRDDVRRDHVRWIHPEEARGHVRRYLERLETLRRVLNRTLFLGLNDWEGHFAVYPPGAFYRLHVDRFRDDDRRLVTTVLYLNAGWQPEDGGALRVYLAPEVDGRPAPSVEIPPVAGTLVTFLSDGFPHEVLPAAAERMSLTGWFRRA